MKKSIKISPRYFETIIKEDYSNWVFAWIREVSQNSLDAEATRVDVDINYSGENNQTAVTWRDNGYGMGKDIIIDCFMALGESQKQNEVGGFGMAAALIAFAQKSYTIRSQECFVTGAGNEYSLLDNLEIFKGTELTVVMEGNVKYELEESLKTWQGMSSTACEFYLNGDKIESILRQGRSMETDWCDISLVTKCDSESLVYVRINGQLMFSQYSSMSHAILVDLKGSSMEYLTTNRDGLKWQYRDKLASLILEICQDPTKIGKAKRRITVYKGPEGKTPLGKAKKVTHCVTLPQIEYVATTVEHKEVKFKIPKPQIPRSKTQSVDTSPTLLSGHNVAIINETTAPTPARFLPETMSKASWRLLQKWERIIKKCGDILDRTENVTVGFIFSHDMVAAHINTNEYGHLILINPVIISDRDMKNRWDETSKDFYQMLANAVHEICHMSYSHHGEQHAVMLTNAMAKLLSMPITIKKLQKSKV